MSANPREVILVTKTVTQNQGNQALSVAWCEFLTAQFPRHRVRPVERAPSFLKRYRADRLARAADPVAAFEAIARRLVARATALPDAAKPAIPPIRHDPRIAQPVRFKRLRRLLRLRSRLAALGLARRAYFARLALFRDADLVVVNPAGEFQRDATDTAIAYLLDLRCAQLMGAKVAMVNLSFEVEHPAVRRISAAIMDRADILEFRDAESREEYAAAGGARAPLVLPDGALMTTPLAAPDGVPGGGVALAINALQVSWAGLEAAWAGFLDRMIAEGIEPVLTSNEWTTDEPFWGPLIAGGRTRAVGREADFRDYMRLLGTFEVVVSSRLHTCVLAILAGTAVIPVETGTFKLTGFFRQAELGVLPIKLGSADWEARIIARIAGIRADRAGVLARQTALRDAARARLISSLADAFGALGLG